MVILPRITDTAARALEIIAKQGPVTQGEFGCAMWPNLKMPRCMGTAGSYLGRLCRRKLVRFVNVGPHGYTITGLGLRALGAHEGEGTG